MVIRTTRGGGSFPSLIGGGPPFMDASGGTVTTSGDFKLHTYNSGGTFVVSALGTDGTYGKAVNMVAIGGGGGQSWTGGPDYTGTAEAVVAEAKLIWLTLC